MSALFLHHTLTLAAVTGKGLSNQTYAIILGAVVLLGLLSLVMDDRADRTSIRENLRSQGATLQFIKRSRMLQGWLYRERGNYYAIRYRDVHGWEHTATCHMPADGGVYYADDNLCSPVAAAPPPSSATVRLMDPAHRIAELEAENRRIKSEMAVALQQLKTLERKLDRAVEMAEH